MHSGFALLANRPLAATAVVAISGGAEVEAQELRQRVAANAAAMRKQEGARWLPLADNALDFSVALLSLLSAGKTAVIAPSSEAAAASDKALDIDGVISPVPQPALDIPVQVLLAADAQAEFRPIPGDAEIELFTSGSTGTPKCIRKKFRQLTGEARVLSSTFDAALGDVSVLATVPHHHIYGLLFRVIWPLISGRPFHAEQTLTPRSRHGLGSILVSSPAFMKRLVDPVELGRNSLRAIFSSGGALAPALAQSVAEVAACPLIEIYGSTETGGIAWRRWPDGDGSWQFFEGLSHKLERFEGDQHRLHVSSAATDNQWIDTGDVIQVMGNGFELLGRADGVLKIEDKRVSLAAIEESLEGCVAVRRARVIVLEGSRRELAAVIQLHEQADFPETASDRRQLSSRFKQHLAGRFDHVAMPRRWRFVTELPLNDMGKTTNDSLLKLFRPGEKVS